MERSANRQPARVVTAALAAALWAGAAASAAAGSNTVLIVDASNSMNSPFDGTSRMEALKEAISAVAPRYGDRIDLGITVFGSRERQNCGDIVSLAAPGPDTAVRAGDIVRSIGAQGVSGVAYTLQAAAEQASYRDRTASIVLVADSAGVDNCRLDTCPVAAALESDAADLTVHVIAIDAKAAEIPKLQCVAAATGGSFALASDRTFLAHALDSAFALAAEQVQIEAEVELAVATPRPKPRPPSPPAETASAAETIRPADSGDAGPDAVEPPGDETTVAAVDTSLPLGQRPPRVKPLPTGSVGETAAESDDANVSVFAPTGADLNGVTSEPGGEEEAAGALQPQNESVMAPSGQFATAEGEGAAAAASSEREAGPAEAPPAPDSDPRQPVSAGDRAATAVGNVSPTLPAPPMTTVLLRRGSPPTTASIGEPAPVGPESEGGKGKVRLAAYIIADTKPVASGMDWQLVAMRDGIPGALVARSSDAAPELDVPAGDYQVRGTFGNASKSAELRVEDGATETVDLVLEAGGLQIVPLNAGGAAPEDKVLNNIYSLAGSPQPVVQRAPSGQVVYLNAGTYRIESRYGDANAVAVADINVQPGKLTKAKINHRAGSVAFRLVAEGSGEPLGDTVWQVLTSDGRVVARSRESTPTHLFAEGSYDVVVRHEGKTYRSTFKASPGESTTQVEIVAR